MLIIFLGPPGAGKGTQALRLAEHLKVVHLSTGDMLRDVIQAGGHVGEEAARFIDQGQLAPDELVVDMVMKVLSQPSLPGAVLDGFPRNLPQAEALDLRLRSLPHEVSGVVQLVVEAKELHSRLMGRGRNDDTPETVEQRLEVYRAETKPLVNYYTQRSLLDVVDGMGTTDQVFRRICDAIERRQSLAKSDDGTS